MRTGRTVPALLCGCLLACRTARPAELAGPGCRLRLTATTPVTVTLGAGAECAQGPHFYRNAAGEWVTLTGLTAGAGTVTFSLDPAQIPPAGTTVILGKPDAIDLSDAAPPRLLKATLDGREVTWPPEGLELGWVDAAPAALELHVADDLSALDPTSLALAVNGKPVPPGAAGVRFAVDGTNPRRAVLSCDVGKLLGDALQGTVRIAFACDDRAIDEQRFETRLSFTASARPTIIVPDAAASAVNGIRVAVDSSFAGYENAACLADGATQTSGSTTRGVTWASAETPTDHWVCLLLPSARRVSGLEISWAEYNTTFWTSARYEILTWDGSQWQRALRIPENPEARASRHEFTPRTTDRVLLWVPAGGNHPRRPDLTWITEMQVLE